MRREVLLYGFDLLELKGEDCRRYPLEKRKATILHRAQCRVVLKGWASGQKSSNGRTVYGEKTSTRRVGHCPIPVYGDQPEHRGEGIGGTVTGIARPRGAVKPQRRFCGAPQARGLTAKARTERSSCRRDARRRRTLSERSSTRFYIYGTIFCLDGQL